MNLNSQPRVVGLANALNLESGNAPVETIRAFCLRRVRRFLRGVGNLSNIGELQRIICAKLNLTVEEVWSDADVEKLRQQYIANRELIVASLPSQLSDDAFGVLFRLTPRGRRARFLAVIDCRGTKYLRRYWTLWHEIAHCLTDVEQFQLPLRRTERVAKEPLEQLTDLIASDFAFYEPIFLPVFKSEFASEGRLSFALVERVRSQYCDQASLAATINACVAASPEPTLLLEAGLAYKNADRIRRDAGDLTVQANLRVLKSIPNDAARRIRLHVPRRWRVPSSSVIAEVHSATADDIFSGHGCACENLSEWTTSDGSALSPLSVMVEARRSGDHVLALITAA